MMLIFFFTCHLSLFVPVFIKHDYSINKWHPLSTMYILWYRILFLNLHSHSIRLCCGKRATQSFLTLFSQTFWLLNSSTSSPQGKSNIEAQQNPSIMYVRFMSQEQTLFQSSRVRSSRYSAVSLWKPLQPVRQRCRQSAEKWHHLAVLRPPGPQQLSLWGSPSSQAAEDWEETLVFL